MTSQEYTEQDAEAVDWLFRVRELQGEPWNLTTAEAIEQANREDGTK